MEGKNSSRFSTLRVLKLVGTSKPPAPPPKDVYNITPYWTPAASTSQLTLNNSPGSSQDLTLMPSTSSSHSPNGDDARFLHPHSPRSPQHSSRSNSPTRTVTTGGGGPFKKLGLSKLSSLGKSGKRSNTAGSLPHSPSMSALPEHPLPEHEFEISPPWNFQHHVHVNGNLHGLPPSWSASLAEAGFNDNEIAALRSRRPIPNSSANAPPTFTHPFANPNGAAPPSVPPPSVPIIVKPKPRSDSLRRAHSNMPATPRPSPTIPTRAATANAAITASTSASSALHFTRRPSSPASSSSSHPATSNSNTNPNTSPQTPATSPIDSPAPSLAHSSGPSHIHVPPVLPSLRVVNDDPPDSAALMSPPPAYAVSSHTLTPPPPVEPMRRRGSTEKLPLPTIDREPEPETRASDPARQEDGAAVAALMDEYSVEEEPLEERGAEEPAEEDNDDDDVGDDVDPDLVTPLASQTRMPMLPPRLSLHTDQDDGWAAVFASFARDSGAAPSRRPSVQSKRESLTLQERRRSKRFIPALALNSDAMSPSTPAEPSASSSALAGPSSAPAAASSESHDASSALSGSSIAPNEVSLLDAVPQSPGILFVPPRRGSDFGIFTPDPAYPIANSPLWEEVRTLVRRGALTNQFQSMPTVGEKREEPPATQQDSQPAGQPNGAPSEQPEGSPADESLAARDSLAPPSPGHDLRSRFSDASELVGPPSRFSDATSIQGTRLSEAPQSRFSDATSFAGHSRFSDVSDMSRVSLWSSTAQHAPSAYFATLDPTPESPPVSPSDSAQRHFVYQAPVYRGLPPPLPPPTQSLPPVPPSAEGVPPPLPPLPAQGLPPLPPPPAHALPPLPPPTRALPLLPPPTEDLPPPPSPTDDDDIDLSRISHLSDSSSELIHGARLATRNAIPFARAVRVSFMAPAPLSPPPPSPQVRAPPPQTNGETPTALQARGTPTPPLARTTPTPPLHTRTTPTPPPLARATPTPPLQARGTPTPPLQARGTPTPPPLPLPPTGKVLPSLIREAIRRQRSEDDASASASSGSPAASDGSDVLFVPPAAVDDEGLPASPMLAYLEDDVQRALSEQEQEDEEEDDDTVPLARLRERGTKDAAPTPVDDGVDVLIKSGAVLVASPAEISASGSSQVSTPLTPSITVNGVAPPDPASDYEDDEELPEELPLVLTPLREYIDVAADPCALFVHLQEVAQGQYGSVYAAQEAPAGAVVAVKKVPIPLAGTPKIAQLHHELGLMAQVQHEHILSAEALFWDPTESALWVRMELMERSLADVIGLHDDGLVLQETVIARFASDILLAITHLYELNLAHRDVRSDNILINSEGILKLAEFSNTVRVNPKDPFRFEIVGVHHWQAPEIRRGRYDASLVDVWSLGATCWEMAESIPPFAEIEDTRSLSDRWPPLSHRDTYSPEFHDFLRLCSEPPASRPSASQLLQHQFIQQACPRENILQVLHICRQLEEEFHQ